MLRPVDQFEIDSGYLGPMKPERILFEFDGPRTFTARDTQGELLLLHQCGESPDKWRYFVVPFSDSLLAELEEGRLDLRAALEQPRLWIADFNGSGVTSLYRVQERKTIEPYLPVAGTMVYPDLEPLLSVRSMGQGIEFGQATLGVLRTALDNVRSALKTLAEFATGEVRKRGQPSSKTRRYYDLPALVQAGSVRVSVLPEPDLQQRLFETDDVWQRMEAALQRGFRESTRSNTTLPESDVMDDELRAALQAVYLLAPPSFGAVETTEVSGRLAQPDGRPTSIVITRPMRAALRQRLRLKADQESELKSLQGVINELDREEATCLLRDHDGNLLLKLSFDEPFFDSVKEAFDTQQEVSVAAQVSDHGDTAELLGLTFAIKHPTEGSTREVAPG